LYVDQGNLIAYEESVDFDIKTISGPFNWFFGGEGVFVGALRGPGKVWLQTRKYMLGSNMNAAYTASQARPLNRVIGCLISIGVMGFIFFMILLESFLK
jgi:hypothetical protein